MRDIGPVISRGSNGFRMAWGFHSHLKWLPKLLQRGLVRIWNIISCRILGHYYLPDTWEGFETGHSETWSCSYCCKTVLEIEIADYVESLLKKEGPGA